MGDPTGDLVKPTLWAVSHNNGDEGHLVMARSREEAESLYSGVTHFDAEAFIAHATPAEWRPSTIGPVPIDRFLGIWIPSDPILAGYGFFPSEDYQECPSCGLILDEDQWSEERADEDVCDECQEKT